MQQHLFRQFFQASDLDQYLPLFGEFDRIVGVVDQDLAEPEGIAIEQGVKLVVSAKNLPYLDGMEVDYAKQGLNEGFRFRNPNVKDTCGCGESFNV